MYPCVVQILRLEAQQKKRFKLSVAAAADSKTMNEFAGYRRRLPVTPTGEEKPSLSAGSLLKDIKRQAKQALDEMR